MAIGTVLATGFGVAKAAGVKLDDITGLFGGGKTFTDCGAEQDRVANELQQWLTQDDLDQIADDHVRNVGALTGRDPHSLAFHVLGGDDCQVTTQEGRAWTNRVDRLVRKRQRETREGVPAGSTGTLEDVASTANWTWIVAIVGIVLSAFYFFNQ